jgi:hypothetical protein
MGKKNNFQTLRSDIQTIIDTLKEGGKAFSYIGLHPVDDNAYRLRLKADWFDKNNRWEDLTTVSRTISALTKSEAISQDTFFAIRGIDLLETDEEDNDSIPWEIFKLSDEELHREVQRRRKVIYPNIPPISISTTPARSYHYELKQNT